jgi:vacuolar protein sorting-associated protein 13A/C
MFEGYLAFYLNKYLGQYVEGIDQKQFRVSIYKGDVVLNNLRLKPDALAALDLPVTVRAGLLGSLTLKVPWSSLGTVPVEAKIDRLYLLASPKTEEERGKGVRKESDLEPCFQLAKRQRVAAQEERWVAELEAAQEAQDKAEAAAQGDQGGGGVGGMLKAVIDTVIGNLQLSISNVHIRYEDAYTNPGHPFACGITLDRISGYTIDELGREAFITNNPLQMLRKALTLRRIAVYFDTDSEFWAPGAAWRDLAPHDWDDWFLPGVSAGRQERGGTARSRQYVLQPVDGQARYTRRGAGVQAKEDEPVLELDFQLNDVAVCLTRPQYQSYHLLLAEVSSFSARLPYAGYRPRLRPAAGETARLWWRYALKAVQQQLAARKLTWSQAVRFARMRKEYVPAYAEHLRQLAAGQGPQRIERLPAPVVEMDRQLPEQTILMFRRLAHAKVQREKRRAAKEAAAAGKSGGGGWMDWLRGGGGSSGSRTASPRAIQAGAEETAPELTSEEYGRLVELVEQQEQGMRLGPETPYTLLTRIGARVASASALLLAADGSRVLRGGLEDIHLTLDHFPATLRLQLGVGGMGLECPEGTLIRTGGQLHRLVSETDLTAEMTGPAGAAAAAAQRALAVQFVQKPQDGSADALLDVVLTPSYVVYSATAVDRVVQFFRTPQELDFSSLSAQATTQLERARRLAAQYAAAALQSRPKLKLHLELDAPKVAIPAADAKGRATLALDFGRFIIESDPDTPAKLPAEEAALYECVRLEVSDVAAYVADGDFDWQDEQSVATAGEGGQPGQLIPLLNRTGMSIALQASGSAFCTSGWLLTGSRWHAGYTGIAHYWRSCAARLIDSPATTAMLRLLA